jgi:hypothetical protein
MAESERGLERSSEMSPGRGSQQSEAEDVNGVSASEIFDVKINHQGSSVYA